MSSYSTIEAQSDLPVKARSLRRFRDLFGAKIDDPNDLAEQELKSVFSESSGGERDSLEHLLRDYRRFKNDPSSAVSNDMLQCWTFQESVGDDVIHSRASTYHASCYFAEQFDKAKLMFYQRIVRPLLLPLSQHYHGIYLRRIRTDYECCTFAICLLPA